jgi:hypothetical protein
MFDVDLQFNPTVIYLPTKLEEVEPISEEETTPFSKPGRKTAASSRKLKSKQKNIPAVPDNTEQNRKKVNNQDEPAAVCVICNKKFHTQYKLRCHLYNHKEPKLQCDRCGKCFLDNFRLTAHKFSHSDVRNIKCPLCPNDKGYFKDKLFLRSHFALCHSVESKYFKCAVCSHASKTKEKIKSHLGVHFPHMRRFVCEIKVCEKTFILRRDLLLHTQRTHRGERPFKCDLCPKTYLSAQVLRDHKKVVHMNFRFDCKFCDKPYKSTSALLEHLFSHREEKPYNCGECANRYISRKNFKNHLRKCHNIIYDMKVHGYKGSFPDILKEGMKQQEVDCAAT